MLVYSIRCDELVLYRVDVLLYGRCHKALLEADLHTSMEQYEALYAYSYGIGGGEPEVEFHLRNCDSGNYRVEVLSIFCAAIVVPLTFRDN